METLIGVTGGPGSETCATVEQAEQVSYGRLYYFLGTVQGFPTGAFTPLTMHRADADSTALRTDTYTLEEVLWASDASGAVIMEVAEDQAFPTMVGWSGCPRMVRPPSGCRRLARI